MILCILSSQINGWLYIYFPETRFPFIHHTRNNKTSLESHDVTPMPFLLVLSTPIALLLYLACKFPHVGSIQSSTFFAFLSWVWLGKSHNCLCLSTTNYCSPKCIRLLKPFNSPGPICSALLLIPWATTPKLYYLNPWLHFHPYAQQVTLSPTSPRNKH